MKTEGGTMQNQHRRPAGVDPSVLAPPTSLDSVAHEIGRRVAMKVLALRLAAPSDTPIGVTPEGEFLSGEALTGMSGEQLADIVEAEIRSTAGTPPVGVVDVRLSYEDALTALVAIVADQGPERTATEAENLADLREKLFRALGIGVSC